MSLIKVKSKKEFLSKMIDLTLLLKLPKQYYLRDREKEFLINSILLTNQGYELESAEMVRAVCSEMNINSSDVYNYRNILKKKGWLIQTVDGLELLLALDYSDRNIPEVIDFKVTLKLDE
jgi:hypothetical protein